MTYFRDLTPYSYSERDARKNMLNIGWLSSIEEYETGSVSLDFIEKLLRVSKKPEMLYRGVHYCEFCSPPEFKATPNSVVSRTIKDCPNGNGEIRVKGPSGVVYVAPILVVHYIQEHNYKPPNEFINAVLQCNV